jgi:hypothetical protein
LVAEYRHCHQFRAGEQIIFRSDRIEINIRRCRFVGLLGAQSIDLTMPDGTPGNESDDVLTLTVMARLKRVGREMRMLVENTDDLRNIAREERVSGAYVYCLLRLPSLAPDIVTIPWSTPFCIVLGSSAA